MESNYVYLGYLAQKFIPSCPKENVQLVTQYVFKKFVTALRKPLKQSNIVKKKSPGAKSLRKKLSCDGSGNLLNLKKQVDSVNLRVSRIVSEMANDPNISLPDFVKSYRKVTRAFEIMDNVISLGEEMKKLKEDGKH